MSITLFSFRISIKHLDRGPVILVCSILVGDAGIVDVDIGYSGGLAVTRLNVAVGLLGPALVHHQESDVEEALLHRFLYLNVEIKGLRGILLGQTGRVGHIPVAGGGGFFGMLFLGRSPVCPVE